MALASQSGRPISRSRYMYRRRRRRSGRWLALLLVLAVAALITWGFWSKPKDTHATALLEAESTSTLKPTPDVVAAVTTHTNTAPVAPLAPSNARLEATEPEPDPASTTELPATTLPAETVTSATEIDANTLPTPESLQPTSSEELSIENGRINAALALTETDPFAARAQLSNLVASGALSAQDAARARQELTFLGQSLLFDPSLLPDDQYARRYNVQSGDTLERIIKRENINAEWGMLQLMNAIKDPDRIRVGQRLKVPVGTFHAIVHKSDYVLDLYLENDDGSIIVASFPVGLGEFNGTPVGRFKVRKHSKLVNPQWRHPRTGEFFLPDDPKNPIGERWIGLEGIDPTNTQLVGYGIHGTIDANSIGQNRSMGCIRLLHPNVVLIYDALIEQGSTITIRE